MRLIQKKTTKWAITKDFLYQKKKKYAVETYSASELNETLWEFYASLQTTTGREYSVASLMCIRAGINRYITKHNIINDKDFKSSNAVFKSIIKRYRKMWKDTSVHHALITESDWRKLKIHLRSPHSHPSGLYGKFGLTYSCVSHGGGEKGTATYLKKLSFSDETRMAWST